MATQELMPFWCIVEQLRQFCAERLTGTVFIVSDDNRMAQVQLDAGNIVMLLCRGRRGREALATMRTMLHARLRFDASVVAAPDAERLDTGEVIDQLGMGKDRADGEDQRREAAPQAARVPPAADAVTPEQAARLERLLVQYIGPMAQIVCAEHVAGARDLRSLVLALAGDIPDKRQADAFQAAAGALLGPG